MFNKILKFFNLYTEQECKLKFLELVLDGNKTRDTLIARIKYNAKIIMDNDIAILALECPLYWRNDKANYEVALFRPAFYEETYASLARNDKIKLYTKDKTYYLYMKELCTDSLYILLKQTNKQLEHGN